MNIDNLKTFCAVAKVKSFSKATDEVYLTQSAISRQIAQLEQDLNTKLFIRKRDGIALTKQGDLLLERAKRIIADVETMKNVVSSAETEISGSLKVTMTVGTASMWMPFFVKDFGDKYPDIKLTIVADDEELDLSVREADVAIRPYIPNRPDLEQRLLQSFSMKLYASPEYLEEFGVPKKPEDLKSHRLLTFGDSKLTPYSEINWLLKLGLDKGEMHAPFVSVNSGSALFEMAEQGAGVASLSREYLQLKANRLVNILPDVEGTKVDMYYVYPKELESFKHITVLGDYLCEKLREKGIA